MAEKPHAILLFLDSPLYVATTRFQALNKLGKSHAGLLIFITGLRKLDMISEKDYQYYLRRYSQPLRTTPTVEDPRIAKQKEEIFERERKRLCQVIEDFDQLQPKTQSYWLRFASERPDIPESLELLRKYGEEGKT